MATIFIYRVGGDVPSCPVCAAWEGAESRNRADLPAIPNPACLAGSHNCHCFVVEVAKEDDEGGGGGGDDGGGGRGGGGLRDGGARIIIIDLGGGGGGGDGDVSIDWDPYDDYWAE